MALGEGGIGWASKPDCRCSQDPAAVASVSKGRLASLQPLTSLDLGHVCKASRRKGGADNRGGYTTLHILAVVPHIRSRSNPSNPRGRALNVEGCHHVYPLCDKVQYGAFHHAD